MGEPLFAVRCLFRFNPAGDAGGRWRYEERVTLWRARSFEEAIERAEADAQEYAALLDATYAGLAQAFHLSVEGDVVGDGDEVFSLMRDSDLEQDEYIERFFETGTERQGGSD